MFCLVSCAQGIAIVCMEVTVTDGFFLKAITQNEFELIFVMLLCFSLECAAVLLGMSSVCMSALPLAQWKFKTAGDWFF